MPILRHTSSTLVPSSFCFNANAIWSSLNLLFLTTCSWPSRAFIMPGVSVTKRDEILGQGHVDQFIENMVRTIPQLQGSRWPSAIVELMRAAYVEATSRHHPGAAQI